jgi:hypothetical protein
VSNSVKKYLVRTTLNPNRMPTKVAPAKEAELARRTAAWNRGRRSRARSRERDAGFRHPRGQARRSEVSAAGAFAAQHLSQRDLPRRPRCRPGVRDGGYPIFCHALDMASRDTYASIFRIR